MIVTDTEEDFEALRFTDACSYAFSTNQLQFPVITR